MPSYSQAMKAAILNDLNALVTSGVLSSVAAVDYSKFHAVEFNYPSFPSAVVLPPTVSAAEYEDQATNNRTYTWNILVVTQPERLIGQNSTALEALVDSILNAFDLDCTLQGTAIGAVSAALVEPPGPISNGSITYAAFYVVLKARQLVPAGVQ